MGFEVVTVGDRGASSRLEHALAQATRLSHEVVAVLETYSVCLENADELFRCPCGVCFVYDQAAWTSFAAPVVLRRPGWPQDLGGCGYFDPDPLRARTHPDHGRPCACARLPMRYAAFALWLGLNADASERTRLVRVANRPPPEWEAARRARFVHLAMGPMRPWHWWASVPLGDRWRFFRDQGYRSIDARPEHSLTRLETRASENFALCRALVLPWLAALVVARRRGRRRLILKKRSRLRTLFLGHFVVIAAAALAVFISAGSSAYHTFFRPSRQLLHKRAPAAPAAVFYSSAAAFLFLGFCLLDDRPARWTLLRVGLAVSCPAALHAAASRSAPTTLVDLVLPLALAFLAVPVAAAFAVLGLAADGVGRLP